MEHISLTGSNVVMVFQLILFSNLLAFIAQNNEFHYDITVHVYNFALSYSPLYYPLLSSFPLLLGGTWHILHAVSPKRFSEEAWPPSSMRSSIQNSRALSHWEITLHTWVSLASHYHHDFFDIPILVIAPRFLIYTVNYFP
jgi:hypothetical protein